MKVVMVLRTSCTNKNKNRQGFTVVELLIVVVVIAILAAITIVTYNGILNKAKDIALQSDLKNATTAVRLASLDATTPLTQFPSDVTSSSGIVLSLTDNSGYEGDFCVNGYEEARKKVMSYADIGGLKEGLCPGKTLGSPVGGAIPPTMMVLIATRFAKLAAC